MPGEQDADDRTQRGAHTCSDARRLPRIFVSVDIRVVHGLARTRLHRCFHLRNTRLRSQQGCLDPWPDGCDLLFGFSCQGLEQFFSVRDDGAHVVDELFAGMAVAVLDILS